LDFRSAKDFFLVETLPDFVGVTVVDAKVNGCGRFKGRYRWHKYCTLIKELSNSVEEFYMAGPKLLVTTKRSGDDAGLLRIDFQDMRVKFPSSRFIF